MHSVGFQRGEDCLLKGVENTRYKLATQNDDHVLPLDSCWAEHAISRLNVAGREGLLVVLSTTWGMLLLYRWCFERGLEVRGEMRNEGQQ